MGPTSLTFNPTGAGIWGTPQTVTVTGVDDDVVDGSVAYTIVTGPASSSDPNYNGLNPPDVSVTNNDDDAAETVMPTSGFVTDETGGDDRRVR